MDFYGLEIKIDEMVTRFIRDLPSVNASKVGLDGRCGNVIVGEDFIGVNIYNDGSLQYYGGFEYIDKEQRKQYGDWVFYMIGIEADDRIAECIERFNERVEA